MQLGITIRNMGPQSDRVTLTGCARLAEELGFESVWITDHIAIPPDDAQGSDGRYLDPLITLAYLAAATDRLLLGTGVLILPYRPALPTAKQVATLQELAGGRLLLGVGVGWMRAEFAALGLERRQRGRLTDATLEFLHECFANDVVQAHGQPFLFRPRPVRPPIYVGGAAPHALERAARHGDGWLPMGLAPEPLAHAMAQYAQICSAAGRSPGTVTLMRGLPLQDPGACRELVDAYRQLGVERLVCATHYQDAAEFRIQAEGYAALL